MSEGAHSGETSGETSGEPSDEAQADAERLRRRAAVLSEIDGTRRLRGRLVAKYARIERVRAALQAHTARRTPPGP